PAGPDARLRLSRRDGVDLTRAGVAHEIDASAVPVIVEMARLRDVAGQIGIEQPGAFAVRPAYAGIDDTFGAGRPERRTELLAGAVVVGRQRRRIHAAQIVQRRGDVEHELAELRGPARRLMRARHESPMV